MSLKTALLELDAEHRNLLRWYAAFLSELRDLTAAAPDGSALDICGIPHKNERGVVGYLTRS